ncbi:hypothetical protein QJV38_12655 [Listeria cossartiae subsp. cayugensis]|uniref:Uncharacterized protein n=1 Tax=Listeria cossartiae subsp. cayugensis TaxID=2713505 RepID=A0ABU2IRK6_9LIST|nr:hypothetical protein [Listeria cossartiae]MDT0050634.1 hypothetical protein [Listeria cossartiae subsp. cayugensis]MDT0067136.1 hypothetical protein [Listeria cossartiae subsp. cayugensis]MDT0080879.1 hypothetical protein [Listeria cossartiae subsp. cayugensis]MDT0083544.1 hypothetical protein [Listeria cossartiae subsp. cayugensis]MDT0089369.1 hypothetical protein [Listeria cossartiae subsp. cayugensis]
MKKHIVLIVVACITVIAVFMYIVQVNNSELKYQNRAQIKIASQMASEAELGNSCIISEITYK